MLPAVWQKDFVASPSPEKIWEIQRLAFQLLRESLEGLYERGIFVHSRVFDVLIRELRGVIEDSEELLGLGEHPKQPFLRMQSLFLVQGKPLFEAEYQQSGLLIDNMKGAGLPDTFVTAWTDAETDKGLWQKGWKERLLLYKSGLERQPMIFAHWKDDGAESRALEVQRSYRRARSMMLDLRGHWAERMKAADSPIKRSGMPTTLVGSVRYDPASGQPYYGDKKAGKRLQRNSQRAAIWMLMYRATSFPPRVFFEEMERHRNEAGERPFNRKIDESITSTIGDWNAPFRKFGVTVFHKDGQSVILEETPIPKTKTAPQKPLKEP